MFKKIKHGNIDTFSYNGLKAIQIFGVHKAFDKLYRYTEDDTFDTIIELGADYGGLTNMLADAVISSDAHIHTFDLNVKRFENLNRSKITFHCLDIYKSIDEIAGYMRGRTLILCDGGNKKLEWESFSRYLKSGDIIMAHDYFPDSEAHQDGIEQGRWNWWEFADADIVGQDLFKPLDCFDRYCWCIREKK